jgi:hypothetical protein
MIFYSRGKAIMNMAFIITLSRLYAISRDLFISVLILLSAAVFTNASAMAIEGCQIFPHENIWNTPIDTMPVAANSSAYISTIGSAVGLHPDFGTVWEGAPIGIPYNVVPGSQPKVDVVFKYADESDPGPYPIPSDASIEGGSLSGGDRHVLVLDKDNCLLYETWSSYPQSDGTWKAGSGAVYDLKKNILRPNGWTSADAAGLPILPGLVRYDEVASGQINHALRFTAPDTRNTFIWPARHYASNLTSTNYPPMGQRFRLKADFNISGFSPPVIVILRALKKYGMILADNGSSWFISGAPDSRWNDDMLVNELKKVHGSDFEAVNEATLMVNKDSGEAVQLKLNPNPPATPVRHIFVHHSTGQNWLSDDNGMLGLALRNNNYFVSDTNYDWGPDSIGDRTDIGNWWDWFRGPNSATYMSALYQEGEQHCSYSRLPAAPAGDNNIIMFKSCFPNSALQGSPNDPLPPIASNPLRGQSSDSQYHTVSNAKGIYIDLLKYFRTRPDKLFIAIAAPPLSDPTYSTNARAFNEWLLNSWLKNYPYKNVHVFDFYNVLTTNGGSPDNNDLGWVTGNHHRLWNNMVQHKTDGDDSGNPNTLEYPSGDDHPSQAGNLKATSEFTTLLNIFYNCWKGTGACPSYGIQSTPVLSVLAVSPSSVVLNWKDGQNNETGFKVERKPGNCSSAEPWAQIGTTPSDTSSYNDTTLSANTIYSYRIRAYNSTVNYQYSNCAFAKTGATGSPASPSGLRATSISSGTVSLSWQNNAADSGFFRIFRKTADSPWSVLFTTPNAVTLSYNDTGATGNNAVNSYSYRIQACNASGCSPLTAAAAVPHGPTVPAAVSNFQEQITLKWKDNSEGETGFEIFRKDGSCTAGGAWIKVCGTPAEGKYYVDTGLTSGSTYSYRVRAFRTDDAAPISYGYSLKSGCSEAMAK